MGSRKYRDFYYPGPERLRVFNPAAAQWDAPINAKPRILAEDGLDRSASGFRARRDAILDGLLKKSRAGIKASMRAMRGFSSDDLDKIATAFEAAFLR